MACLFPDKCCMPGYHTSDECHTAEMMEEIYEENEPRAVRDREEWKHEAAQWQRLK